MTRAVTLQNRTVYTLIAMLVLFGWLFTTINLAHAQESIVPVSGTIAHSFLDREADVIVGFLYVNDTTYGFSFLREDTMVSDGSTSVYTITTDTIAFEQNDHMFTASIVSPLELNGELSDLHHVVYEDNSECNIFTLSIVETNEHLTVCLDPTDRVNATNGLIALTFGNPFYGSQYWTGTISQIGDDGINRQYPFKTLESDPQPHRVFVPVVTH